jgi:SulP family sulfate permease
MNINPTALLLTALTLVILFLTPQKISSKFPATLIALIALSLIAYLLHLDVAYVSNIPSGLPEFSLPTFNLDNISFMVTSALTLALLGTIDTLLTSLVADSITKEKHNSNKELIGQGIGNMAASLFGGLPGAGATMRTVVNIKNGATGKASGMIHAGILLLILLVASPLATAIPMPVLAGILIKVGFDILDYRMLKQLRIAPKNDLSVMAVVLFLTVFVDLIIAVFVGIILASVLIIQRLTKQTEVEISNDDDVDEKYDDRVLAGGKIRIINIKGAFFFGSTSQIIDTVSEVYDVQNVVIDCSYISFMDLSAIYALSDFVAKLNDMNIGVAIVSDEKRKEKLLKLGLGEFIEPEFIVSSQLEAIKLFRKEMMREAE